MVLGILLQAAQEAAAGAAAAATETAAGDAAPAATAAAADAADAAAPHEQHFLVFMLPTLIMGVTLLLVAHACKGLPLGLLGDLIYWYTPKDEQERAAAAAAAAGQQQPGAASPGKKGRRAARAAAKTAAHISATPALSPGYLDMTLLSRMEFLDEYDYLLRAGLLLLLNTGAGVAIKVLLNPAFPLHAFNLYVTALGAVVFFMYQVEWAHNTIGATEKVIMAALAVLLGLTCAGLLLYAPPGALPFAPSEAVLEATTRMAAVARRRFKATSIPPDALQPFSSPAPMVAALSVLGGVLGGLLLAPGIRYGRILHTLNDLPNWARVLRPPPSARLLVQAGFALQLLLTPLFVGPTTDVLRLPPEVLMPLRGMALLLVAALQLGAVPHLVQVFLHMPQLHGRVIDTNPAVSDALRASSRRKSISSALSQTVKVAIQLSFVPVLLLSCALIYLLAGIVSPLPGASELDRRPSAFVLCLAGYLGWWASSVYMAWGSLGLMLGRLQAAGVAPS